MSRPLCTRLLYERPPGEFVYFWAVASPNCAVTLIAAYQSVCSTRAPERAPQTLLAAVHLRL